MIKLRGTAVTYLILARVSATLMVGCIPGYGADADHPDQLPLPPSASQVLSHEGSDDDDPIPVHSDPEPFARMHTWS